MMENNEVDSAWGAFWKVLIMLNVVLSLVLTYDCFSSERGCHTPHAPDTWKVVTLTGYGFPATWKRYEAEGIIDLMCDSDAEYDDLRGVNTVWVKSGTCSFRVKE